MPGPALAPFDADTELPRTVDVVVIGGGIIGASTALELAERGFAVLLCEKGQIGAEQSSRNWGWVRITCRDPREIPLMAEAIRIWEGLDARLERKTGYMRAGIAFGAKTERDIANYSAWAEHLASHQIETRLIRPDEVEALSPGNRMGLKGALFTPIDGRAEPQWAAPAIAARARDLGAKVMTNCAVRSLDLEAGRIAGVMTERGRVRATSVVLAGGAWSRLFAGNAGLSLPQLQVMNTVLRTTPVDGPEAAFENGDFAYRRRADGGYTIASAGQNTVDLVPDSFRLALTFLPAARHEWRSLRFRLSRRWLEVARQARRWAPEDRTPFELCRILDPEPSQRELRRAWAAAQAGLPFLQGADVAQSWAGMIDVTPDAIPVISPVETLPGFHIATGFSGHGFGIGPGAGWLMADIVTGRTPVVDPSPFRLSRFTDGSRIAPDDGFGGV